ncbi:hypothetical protein RDI58_027229 [Solanum bulbocastanum]|uniref:Uncharacterized protein n=1 Tax=Solanum bulbocastanum TaxID=147425 RepID=A0AAN8T216_SOLBU
MPRNCQNCPTAYACVMHTRATFNFGTKISL